MFVLTLVHGTWARGILCPSGDAPWTSDSSALCRSLRDRFGPDLIFRRFRWSGANNHTARVKAAEKLRDYLQDGLEHWPEATHLVIAHSHGGNVALSAMEDSNLQERIAGVACLATPFISARKRDLGKNLWNTFYPSAVMILMLMPLWPLYGLIPTSWPVLVRSGCAWLMLLFLAMVFFLLVKRIAAPKHATKLCRELSPHLPKKDQLLIIRSPADEASGALTIFQFISQVTVRLFLLSQSWYAHVERLMISWAKHKFWILMVVIGASMLGLAFFIGSAGLYMTLLIKSFQTKLVYRI